MMEMPKYLLSKRFLTLSVVIIFLFSIPFLLIYKPFSATIWLGFQPLRNFVFTCIFYALALFAMSLSKVAMFHYQMKRELSAGRFLLWALSAKAN